MRWIQIDLNYKELNCTPSLPLCSQNDNSLVGSLLKLQEGCLHFLYK